jgi:hypothetical protein
MVQQRCSCHGRRDPSLVRVQMQQGKQAPTATRKAGKQAPTATRKADATRRAGAYRNKKSRCKKESRRLLQQAKQMLQGEQAPTATSKADAKRKAGAYRNKESRCNKESRRLPQQGKQMQQGKQAPTATRKADATRKAGAYCNKESRRLVEGIRDNHEKLNGEEEGLSLGQGRLDIKCTRKPLAAAKRANTAQLSLAAA